MKAYVIRVTDTNLYVGKVNVTYALLLDQKLRAVSKGRDL